MARVFVSYRRVGPDDRIAMGLYRRLSDLGHDVFLDSERVRLGTQWPREIRGALERAEHVVALVSLAYLDSRNCVDDELAVAVRRELPIIPVHLAHVGTYPASVRAALVETQAFQWRGEDDTAAMIEHVAGALPHPTSLVEGMLAFEALDAAGFRELGREAEVEQCVATFDAPGVIVVHGVSGAGKTSFLRAGVLPRLPSGSWQLVTATASARIDPAAAAGAARLLVVDQFEQMIVAKDPAFEQPALDWLAAAPDRGLVLVIRDEFRTSLEAIFPRLTSAARNVALFPLDPAHAAAALATILESARIELERAFLDGVTAALVDGVPARVRPALLQLVAQHAIAAGAQRFDAAVWAGTPTQRRAFFERHVRTTVLDQLPAAIPRLEAARALRGLTAAELKSSPRTIAEVADDEQLTPVAVERVLDVAAAPHARVATAHVHGDVEQFELVHDLFAGAIQALVKDEEARARSRAQRRTTIGIAVGAGLIAIAGLAALVLWRRADEARRGAERGQRRELASKLAAMSIRYKDESPGRALALAAEALDATGADGATAEAMRATYDALAVTHGPALRSSSGTRYDATETDVAVSADGRRAAVVDYAYGIQVWDLAHPDAPPRRLANPGVTSLVFTGDGRRLLGWKDRLWHWDLDAAEPRPTALGDVSRDAAVSPDRTTLVVLDRTMTVWDLRAPEPTPREVPLAPTTGVLAAKLLSPAGRWAAIPTAGGYALVDAAGGPELGVRRRLAAVRDLGRQWHPRLAPRRQDLDLDRDQRRPGPVRVGVQPGRRVARARRQRRVDRGPRRRSRRRGRGAPARRVPADRRAGEPAGVPTRLAAAGGPDPDDGPDLGSRRLRRRRRAVAGRTRAAIG